MAVVKFPSASNRERHRMRMAWILFGVILWKVFFIGLVLGRAIYE